MSNPVTERFNYPAEEHEIDYDIANRMIAHYNNAKHGETVNFVGVNRETAVHVRKYLESVYPLSIGCYMDFDYVQFYKK